MALFEVPKRAGRAQDSKLVNKTKSTKKIGSSIKTGNGLLGRISEIKAAVEKNLGQYKNDYIIIQDETSLQKYFQKCLDNNVISIDTETTGLDPILDKIVGLCIYTPNEPAAYIPINHISYITGVRVEEQLDENQVGTLLRGLVDKHPDIIMFNAKFDIRVIRNQLNVKNIYCTWDGYLAGRLMNENEPSGGLKALHKKYVLDGKTDEFSFDALFKGMSFDYVPINVGYLYAAHDAIITYELYQYQKQYLYYDPAETSESRNGMNGVSWVFENIEMPCVEVVADMEDTGVLFDTNYQQALSEKYNNLLEEKKEKFYRLCDDFGEYLDKYRAEQGAKNKLEYPINISSSTQIAIMLYDILKIKSPDPKNPRGTGEPILQKIKHPIAQAILEYREVQKILSTYVDKLPENVNPKDGRIHCSFNQYGAVTGRFSSQDPNLQNIPSHNKDIRKMFVASHKDETIISTENDTFIIDKWDEVNTQNGWKSCSQLKVGDKLDDCIVKSVTFTEAECILEVE